MDQSTEVELLSAERKYRLGVWIEQVDHDEGPQGVPHWNDLRALLTENLRLRTMLERLGSSTHGYLSAVANGDEPTEVEFARLAHMAYAYAFHTDEAVKDPTLSAVTEF